MGMTNEKWDVLKQHYPEMALGLLDEETQLALFKLVEMEAWGAIQYLNGEIVLENPMSYMKKISEAFCMNLSDVHALNRLYRVQHLLITMRTGESPAF